MKKVIIIGINEFLNLPSLHCAVNDAEGVATVLTDKTGSYRFADHEVIVMTCQKGGKSDLYPSRENILKQLNKEIPKGCLDQLFVFFFGHGFGKLYPDGRYDRYLCPVDADKENLKNTGISLLDLTKSIRDIGAMDTCVILDCCQNQPGVRGIDATLSREDDELMTICARDIQAAVRPQQTVRRVPTTILVSSCSADQCAYEWQDKGHSIFAHFLFPEMKNHPDRGIAGMIGRISVPVFDTVKELHKQKQHPFIKLEGSGDIYLNSDIDFSTSSPNTLPKEKESVTTATSSSPGFWQWWRNMWSPAYPPTSPIVQQPKPLPQQQTEVIEPRKPQSKPSNPVVRDDRVAGERMELTLKGVADAFRWCPAGSFMMGSPLSEPERYGNEAQHKVTLTRGFWMLETPVTQLMYNSVMGENPSHWKGDKLPVENVSWEDCQKYISWLNYLNEEILAGFRLTLPTEAQWEYACRACTTTPYHFGKTLNGDKANCNGGYPYGMSKGKYLKKTSEVGSYPANAWGLYDMHGNVWEWCSDWYKDFLSKNATDPVGPSTGSSRVLRGGSWHGSARCGRSARRRGSRPARQGDRIGFRLAIVREE